MGELCGTCRHWLRPEDRTDYGNCVSYADDEYIDEGGRDGFGGYRFGDPADRLFGECQAITLGQSLPPGPPPLAVTQDASNYVADLHTQATFGCAMHTPAAPPPDPPDREAGAGESGVGRG